ncbi:MAG: leucine-rich repeat domain-containing protein [Chloroflexota bacterium]
MSIKRLLTAAVALLLAVSFATPSGVWADSANGFTYDLSPGGATVTGCDGICPITLTIPARLGGQPVTSIGASAFYNNLLTSVTIPNSVTSIGISAFDNNLLTSVTIGKSVTSIGGYAFNNNLLNRVTIPNSVTSIGNLAFAYNHLTHVTIGNSVTSIGDSTFAYNLLTTVTIPDSVTSVGDRAFAVNALTAVTFMGNAPIAVDSDVFSENPDLTHVNRQFIATGWDGTWSEVEVVALPELPSTDREGSAWTTTLVILAGITAAAGIALRLRRGKRA